MSNPFLLPPGSEPTPREPSPAVEPEPVIQHTPVGDPSQYIAVPPSVESATHRFQRETDAVPVAPEPAAEELVAEEPAAEEPVAEETRLAAPQTAEPSAPAIALPDGTTVTLTGPLLLGRDPAPIASRPGAALLAVTDPGKTVSKTHALLEPVDGGVRVLDLHSTNGVAIAASGVRTVLPEAGEGVAPAGSSIELGSFVVRVR